MIEEVIVIRGHLQIDFGTLNVIMTLGGEVQPMTLYIIFIQQQATVQCIGTDKMK